MLIGTSGWFSILDENDDRQDAAVAFFRSASRRIAHSYIIDELVSLCNARRVPRSKVLAFLDELFDDENIRIVWVDESLTKQAFDLLKERPDKSWSLYDAVSFLIMKQENITEALTTDHHFEQAGFVQLLES